MSKLGKLKTYTYRNEIDEKIYRLGKAKILRHWTSVILPFNWEVNKCSCSVAADKRFGLHWHSEIALSNSKQKQYSFRNPHANFKAKYCLKFYKDDKVEDIFEENQAGKSLKDSARTLFTGWHQMWIRAARFNSSWKRLSWKWRRWLTN